MDNRQSATSEEVETKMGQAAYRTPLGEAIHGDSLEILRGFPSEGVDLVMTSPPFALLREKEYGNLDQASYVDWLCSFGAEVLRVLKPSGSLVLDLGGAYRRGVPVRSLYNYRVLLKLVDEVGFHLAEEFFWHNPSKLPSPIEWVNKRKIRVKDSVNTVWWLSKTEWPKADVSRVLAPYSKRMLQLLEDPEGFYTPKDRPSGHDIGSRFARDNGGAIPPNLLQFSNSESNGAYLKRCKHFGFQPHPARFPKALPSFFIRFLTEPDDLVVDIFGGSGTTGEAAEDLGRRWITIELDDGYVAASALRFVDGLDAASIESILRSIKARQNPVIRGPQPALFG